MTPRTEIHGVEARPRRRIRVAVAISLALAIVLIVGYGAWWPTSQLFGETLHSLPANPRSPRVALTFDDGPDPDVTPGVLDVLRDAGAHATFFVCGERAAESPELVARAVAEGHSLGNHSWRHDALIFLSADAIASDLARTDEALLGAAKRPGFAVRWFRPPYGLRDPRVLDAAATLGKTTVMWNQSPRDWQDATAVRIVERVMSDLHDGAIVLLHDGDARRRCGRPETLAALPELLARLRAAGFTCVALDEVDLGAPR